MMNAWRALDQAATAAGHQTASAVMGGVPFVEVRLPDGTLAIIVADAHAPFVERGGGQIWTASEVARVLEAVPTVLAAKTRFPGAEVVSGKRTKFASSVLPDDEIDIPF